MRNVEARLRKLEHPHGNHVKLLAEHLEFLRWCNRIRANIDETYEGPDEATLRAAAERLAATGKTPAQVAHDALVQAWEAATRAR